MYLFKQILPQCDLESLNSKQMKTLKAEKRKAESRINSINKEQEWLEKRCLLIRSWKWERRVSLCLFTFTTEVSCWWKDPPKFPTEKGIQHHQSFWLQSAAADGSIWNKLDAFYLTCNKSFLKKAWIRHGNSLSLISSPQPFVPSEDIMDEGAGKTQSYGRWTKSMPHQRQCLTCV